LKRSRKLLTVVLGIGIAGLLGSLGSYAFSAYTFTFDNTTTMSTATLTLTDTTGFTSAATSISGANRDGTDPRTLAECSTLLVAQTCSSLLRSVNVASKGMEPGQYLRGTISITNGGGPASVPATLILHVQNVLTNNGNNSLYTTGATGTSACPADIAGVASPGTTGAQLTSGILAQNGSGTPVAGQTLTGCQDLGNALRITIHDDTVPQCLFGNAAGTQAPTNSGAVGTGFTAFYAVTGSCDDLSQAGLLGSASSPVSPGANPKDLFGAQNSTAGNTSFAGLSNTNNLLFIPGSGTTKSKVVDAALGGDLTGITQWASNEAHTFTVTVSFPDTGTTQVTDRNNDRHRVSNDNRFQGGAVSFDLYWFAIQ
jgi:hypothetical protein